MSRKSPTRNALAFTTLLLLVEPATADLRGVRTGAPAFSQEELAIIHRNQTLSRIVQIDPWTVRELLDSVDEEVKGRSVQTRQSIAPAPPPREPIDPNADPDLERMQRASPEAVHDLFQLLKRASQKKEEKAR
jgi:hypothetical protein